MADVKPDQIGCDTCATKTEMEQEWIAKEWSRLPRRDPPPGPWRVRVMSRPDRFGDEREAYYVVLDARDKFVAECGDRLTADWIAQQRNVEGAAPEVAKLLRRLAGGCNPCDRGEPGPCTCSRMAMNEAFFDARALLKRIDGE